MPYDIIIGRDDADKARFGNKGLIKLGKGYVKMGQYTSLSNPILMDVARTHVILVAGKRGCLAGDSKVLTNQGYKEIKNFDKFKDKILSYDNANNKFEWENAELLIYNLNEELIILELEDGRKLEMTKEHPLLISSGGKLISLLWMKAENLSINDNLISINDDCTDIVPVKIKDISRTKKNCKVYDLTVHKNHSFIANGIISSNSGKSYTLGVIAEELSTLESEARKNISSLIFDTMGIFWTMKFKNEKEKELLSEWGEKPKDIPVKIFAPSGYFKEYESRQIPVDEGFSIKPSELEAEDWVITFNLSITEPVAITIERAINNLKEASSEFGIEEIIAKIKEDKNSSQEIKNSAIGLFEAASTWKIFSSKNEKATEISDLTKPGQTAVLDLSVYSSVGVFNVRALVISIVCRKLFEQRILARKREELEAVQHGIDYLAFKQEREMPLVWVFIDEVQEFIPSEGKTPATDALIQLLREGRQPGISIVMATQQPGALARDAMTQADIVISHRVTAMPDINSLNQMMQSYLLESIKKQMDDLPNLKGSAIILDDNSERLYPCRIKPRFTWHGGEAPTSIKVERRV